MEREHITIKIDDDNKYQLIECIVHNLNEIAINNCIIPINLINNQYNTTVKQNNIKYSNKQNNKRTYHDYLYYCNTNKD